MLQERNYVIVRQQRKLQVHVALSSHHKFLPVERVSGPLMIPRRIAVVMCQMPALMQVRAPCE